MQGVEVWVCLQSMDPDSNKEKTLDRCGRVGPTVYSSTLIRRVISGYMCRRVLSRVADHFLPTEPQFHQTAGFKQVNC